MNTYKITLANGDIYYLNGASIENFNNIYFEIRDENKEIIAIVPINALIIIL